MVERSAHPAAQFPRPSQTMRLLPVLTALVLLPFLPGMVQSTSLIGQTGCLVDTVVAGGQAIKGSAGSGVWLHYELKLPSAGDGRVQLRVELVQPGRRSFGARLRVHSGEVDCSRRSGFHMQGTRPERCMDYACEQIEWVVIPDARGTFHIAVQSVGDDFYLHASTAAYALNELSDTVVGECSPEDGCYETVGAVGQEGFIAWYRATNTLSIPPEGMASHQFGIRSFSSGHATHLMVRKVAAQDAELSVPIKASGNPDAECFNMATYGWGLTDTFSPPSGSAHAAEFIIGIQVHASGIEITGRNKFLPCTMSGLLGEAVPVCSRTESPSPFRFTFQLRERQATLYSHTASLASEVALGGLENEAVVSSVAERGEWQFFRFRASPPQPTGSAWEEGDMSLVRVRLQLTQTGRIVPRATMRASALVDFPLEQLGVRQYQEATCRGDCALVVALPPGSTEVTVAMQVDNDDQRRFFTMDAVTVDLKCGWLPTCSDCATAHSSGLDCMWTPDETSVAGGFCHSSGGRVEVAPQCESQAEAECHVPESILGDVTQTCVACPVGCGWCGQPFGGGQHAGACVPEALATDTRWVGSSGPELGDGGHLMAAGYCSVWETSKVAREAQRCDEIAVAATAGACDMGSGDCAACSSLSPVCTYCANPEAPGEGGQCVPIAADPATCNVAQYPWLGYGAGELSCPPKQEQTGSRKFTDVVEISTANTELTLPPALALPDTLGGQSLGVTHGIASNAVYVAAQLSPSLADSPAVYNLRLRVAAGAAGSRVKAMAQVGALPVRSSTLAAGTHAWSRDKEDVLLPVGAFLGSGLPRQVLFSLEQVAGGSTGTDVVSAGVSVEVEEGVLVATTLGGTVNSATAPLGSERQVCCGGRLVYRLQVDQPEVGGSVSVELTGLYGSGAGAVTLLASWDEEPTELGSSYRGEEVDANGVLRMGIYLGEAGSERTERTWYVSVNAGVPEDADADGSWSATTASFSIRALRTVPGAVMESSQVTRLAGFETDLPIWQWVLIAIAIGVVLGLFLAVFYVVNRMLYKYLRFKSYEMQASGSFNSPRGDKPLKTAFDEETPVSGTPGTPAEEGKRGTGLLARLIGRGGGAGEEETGGLLKRHRRKKVKWYDPRTFKWDEGEDDSAAHGAEALAGMENKSEAEDVEMVGVLALDTNAAAETRKVEVGGSNNLMDSINSSLWRNSVAASTTAEGDPETPTSATPTTTTGSIVAMSMLNERMAVLAQAEELEENRKPRPDSANPVRSRSQPFLEENKRQSGAAGFVKGGAPTALDLSHTKAPEPTRTWSLNSQSSFNRANASSEAGRGPVAPPPRLPSPDERPPERRRMAPPPLSVMLEDGEPETEEIMMLSEEEAKTISAGGGVNKSNNWREERTVAGLLLADEERSKEEATRASMQSSDIVSFSQDEANADEGDGAAVVSLRQQYRRSSSNNTSGSGGAGSHDGATDEVLLI